MQHIWREVRSLVTLLLLVGVGFAIGMLFKLSLISSVHFDLSEVTRRYRKGAPHLFSEYYAEVLS